MLRVRGQGRRLSEISPVTAARVARGEFGRVQADVPLSSLPGMPGEEAPVYPSGTTSPQIESGPPDDSISQGSDEASENSEQEESK